MGSSESKENKEKAAKPQNPPQRVPQQTVAATTASTDRNGMRYNSLGEHNTEHMARQVTTSTVQTPSINPVSTRYAPAPVTLPTTSQPRNTTSSFTTRVIDSSGQSTQ